METNQQIVGRGIFLIFVSAIVSLFSGLWIVGAIASLVSIGIQIYALYKLSNQHFNYKNAFTVQIILIVAAVLQVVFSGGTVVGTIFNIATRILSFLSVYYICAATGSVLEGISTDLVVRAELIRKLYMVCTIILVVCEVLYLIPLINIIGGLIAAVTAIVFLVAQILYLVFIYKSYKVLSV